MTTINYCKRKNEPTDTVHCLNCEHCLPPGERTGGRMCRDEATDLEVFDIINKGLGDGAKNLLDFQMQCLDADLHSDPHRFDGIASLLHVDFGNTKDARGQDTLSGISNTVFIGTKEQLEKNGQKGLYRIELTDEDKADAGKRKGYQVTMKMDFTKQPRKAMEILEKMTWRDDMSKHEMVRCKIYQTIYKLMEESEGPNPAIDYATGEPFWKYWDMMAEQMPEINEYK